MSNTQGLDALAALCAGTASSNPSVQSIDAKNENSSAAGGGGTVAAPAPANTTTPAAQVASGVQHPPPAASTPSIVIPNGNAAINNSSSASSAYASLYAQQLQAVQAQAAAAQQQHHQHAQMAQQQLAANGVPLEVLQAYLAAAAAAAASQHSQVPLVAQAPTTAPPAGYPTNNNNNNGIGGMFTSQSIQALAQHQLAQVQNSQQLQHGNPNANALVAQQQQAAAIAQLLAGHPHHVAQQHQQQQHHHMNNLQQAHSQSAVQSTASTPAASVAAPAVGNGTSVSKPAAGADEDSKAPSSPPKQRTNSQSSQQSNANSSPRPKKKARKSSSSSSTTADQQPSSKSQPTPDTVISEWEEKKHAKRAANRLSAHLSRKRKKMFIDELKDENTELRRKEQILRSIPDLIVVFDSSGTMSFVSESVSRFLNYSSEELEESSFWDRLSDDSVNMIKSAFMDALAVKRGEGVDCTSLCNGKALLVTLVDKSGEESEGKLVSLKGVVHFAGDSPECVCSIRPEDKVDKSNGGGKKVTITEACGSAALKTKTGAPSHQISDVDSEKS